MVYLTVDVSLSLVSLTKSCNGRLLSAGSIIYFQLCFSLGPILFLFIIPWWFDFFLIDSKIPTTLARGLRYFIFSEFKNAKS